jgi:hypothetical protein
MLETLSLTSKPTTMIKLYSLLFLFLISLTASSQYYQQYFDGADTAYQTSINIEIDTTSFNVWQIGPPQKSIFNAASTVPNVIVTDTMHYYPANNLSVFRIKILNNWMAWGVFALQWNQKLDMDSLDGGIVEFSIDGGVTWQNAFNNPYVYNFYGYNVQNYDTLPTGEFAFTRTDSAWKNIWLCFDLSWISQFPDTLNFRFTLKTDSNFEEKEGWMIDNMFGAMTIIHTVKEASLKDYITVYPNPANGRVNVRAQKRLDYHIIEDMQLINMQGRIVQEWKNVPTKFWFETKDYPDGEYLLRVKTNIKTETKHVVICKG